MLYKFSSRKRTIARKKKCQEKRVHKWPNYINQLQVLRLKTNSHSLETSSYMQKNANLHLIF